MLGSSLTLSQDAIHNAGEGAQFKVEHRLLAGDVEPAAMHDEYLARIAGSSRSRQQLPADATAPGAPAPVAVHTPVTLWLKERFDPTRLAPLFSPSRVGGYFNRLTRTLTTVRPPPVVGAVIVERNSGWDAALIVDIINAFPRTPARLPGRKSKRPEDALDHEESRPAKEPRTLLPSKAGSADPVADPTHPVEAPLLRGGILVIGCLVGTMFNVWQEETVALLDPRVRVLKFPLVEDASELARHDVVIAPFTSVARGSALKALSWDLVILQRRNLSQLTLKPFETMAGLTWSSLVVITKVYDTASSFLALRLLGVTAVPTGEAMNELFSIPSEKNLSLQDELYNALVYQM